MYKNITRRASISIAAGEIQMGEGKGAAKNTRQCMKMERTEKPCNYSLISAKIAMMGIKRRCCSHAFCLLPRDKLSPRVGRAAVKLGAKRDYIDIDVLSILLAYNEKGERC